jgi:hypothetical protein
MTEGIASSTAPVCQPPNPNLTPANFVAPPGSWDCHLHIIGPVEKYPLVTNRSWTPVEANVQDYRRVAVALRTEHAVGIYRRRSVPS